MPRNFVSTRAHDVEETTGYISWVPLYIARYHYLLESRPPQYFGRPAGNDRIQQK